MMSLPAADHLDAVVLAEDSPDCAAAAAAAAADGIGGCDGGLCARV